VTLTQSQKNDKLINIKKNVSSRTIANILKT